MDIAEIFSIEDELLNNSISKNIIAEDLLKECRELGRNLRPITFCEEEKGCVDIATLLLKNDDTKMLWEYIIDFYELVLDCTIDRNNINLINGLVLDYFLRLGICYIEVIKDTYYGSRYRSVSQKYLSTKNEILLSRLLYPENNRYERRYINEIFNKYGQNLEISLEDMKSGSMRYLKLQYLKERKIVKCNKNLDYTKIRFVCLPLVVEWLKGVSEVLKTNYVRVQYLKDDGTDRSVVTTLNKDLLLKFYPEDFVEDMLDECICNTDTLFDLGLESNYERGWVRVPEVGSSMVDDIGVRALNFARVRKLEIVNSEDIDISYINVSLSNVVEYFEDTLNKLVQINNYDKVFRIYVGLQHRGFSSDLSKPYQSFNGIYEVAKELREFISTKRYAGTPFLRLLHTFMVGEPELFNNYTGEKLKIKKQRNYGVSDMDF